MLPPSDLPPTAASAEVPRVVPHPAGGWTHSWPLTGTARLYSGYYETAGIAFRAARGAVSPRLRAALAASRAVAS